MGAASVGHRGLSRALAEAPRGRVGPPGRYPGAKLTQSRTRDVLKCVTGQRAGASLGFILPCRSCRRSALPAFLFADTFRHQNREVIVEYARHDRHDHSAIDLNLDLGLYVLSRASLWLIREGADRHEIRGALTLLINHNQS
jgi:hypothetical protein